MGLFAKLKHEAREVGLVTGHPLFLSLFQFHPDAQKVGFGHVWHRVLYPFISGGGGPYRWEDCGDVG